MARGSYDEREGMGRVVKAWGRHRPHHKNPQKALDIAMKLMPCANKQYLENSLQDIITLPPLVPCYSAAAVKHAQEFMIFGSVVKKDKAVVNFDSIFAKKSVDTFAKPAA